MALLRLDPITRRRFERFRRIRRGWYSLLILLFAMGLSVFASFLAESRALVVRHDGRLYFPTFRYYDMETFGQEPPPAWESGDLETDYYRLQREWRLERARWEAEAKEAAGDPAALAALDAKYPHHDDWVLMPPIPWDPYQSDFWYNEILNEIQGELDRDDVGRAAYLARRDGLDELADAIASGRIGAMLADPERSPTGDLAGLARSGAMSSLAGLAVLPPNPPDFHRRHYLGTDSQGRDVAARLLYGFRISIFFALFLVLVSQAIGTAIGSLQGYLGGRFDLISQRVIEVLVSIPFLYVVIIMGALTAPSFLLLLVILALFQWIAITFYMRTEMYREKTREYALAARSYGA
ncbi:MAG TPA: ABC transporter permease subunit, partial [Longimicrobiales bacterium]|nr:ABC transporter permease subunit [Longimicrobiales bacterium]